MLRREPPKERTEQRSSQLPVSFIPPGTVCLLATNMHVFRPRKLEESRISQNLNKQIRGLKLPPVFSIYLLFSATNIPVHVRKQNFQVQEDSAHLGGINSIKYFYFAKLNSVICMCGSQVALLEKINIISHIFSLVVVYQFL